MLRQLGLVFLVSYLSLGASFTCADLYFEDCYVRDVPSGSYRFEVQVDPSCKKIEVRRYRSDYRCEIQGTLMDTQTHPIDGVWKTVKTKVAKSKDAIEYGKYESKTRYRWDADKVTLIKESEQIEDTYQADLTAAGDDYFKFDKEIKETRRYSREKDEVVLRTAQWSRYKSKFTRNEWLTRSEESIDWYPLF